MGDGCEKLQLRIRKHGPASLFSVDVALTILGLKPQDFGSEVESSALCLAKQDAT